MPTSKTDITEQGSQLLGEGLWPQEAVVRQNPRNHMHMSGLGVYLSGEGFVWLP